METIIEKEIMSLFKEFYEKQEEIEKATSAPFIHAYTHLELHIIDYIGNQEKPNVTSISNSFNITRGAASKITKRLMNKNDIEKYQVEGNKKEIYFKLTKQGKNVFDAHKKRHSIWFENDMEFLNTISDNDKKIIYNFLNKFNNHLDHLLKI